MSSTINDTPRFNLLPYVLQDVQKFTESSNNLACEIIKAHSKDKNNKVPTFDYKGPIVIRHYHYYNDPFWSYPSTLFWPRQQVVELPTNCSSNNSKNDKDDKKTNDLLIGVTAAVVGGVCLYLIGAGMNKLEDANNALDETAGFEKMINRHRGQAQQTKDGQKLLHALDQIVDIKGRICTRLKDSALKDLGIRAGMVASCAGALAGVIGGTQAFITAGVIGGLISGGAMLFKWGYDSTETKNLNDAQSLHHVAEKARKILDKRNIPLKA